MSLISMRHPLALSALVAVVSISSGSALFGLRGTPNHWAFKPLRGDKSDWTPQELILELSKGYQSKWADYYQQEYGPGHEISGIVYSWLSRTGDKNRPKTILNKYSVQDLLDLNLVYDKEATLQEYDRRRQMCDEFAHDNISEDEWREKSPLAQSAEAKLLNQKYLLGGYCWETFRAFLPGATNNIDKQVRRKLAKEDLRNFRKFGRSFMDFCRSRQYYRPKWDELIEEHVEGYDKNELAKLMASCSKLDFLAETYRLGAFVTTKFGAMLDFCKKIEAT